MNFWRRAAGKSRLERIKNKRIQEIMEVEHTIVGDIQVAQPKWYGHVQRMNEGRLPKQDHPASGHPKEEDKEGDQEKVGERV